MVRLLSDRQSLNRQSRFPLTPGVVAQTKLPKKSSLPPSKVLRRPSLGIPRRMSELRDTSARCPVCGEGVVTVIAFDGVPRSEETGGQQTADSREVQTFSCGHEVLGPSLASADQERLDVERRDSQDTVDPLPERG